MIVPTTQKCWANHLGVYACDPQWLAQAVSAIRAGTWQPRLHEACEMCGDDAPSSRTPKYYDLVGGGVAVIRVDGPMMKGWSKYGGTSSVFVRSALRRAAADAAVKSIVLRIDSPGGHVAGTQDLADDVARADETKPVHAYIEDLGASAAYWIASQARTISVNRSGLVGSLGTFTVIVDSSKAAKDAGYDVHVIATGPNKVIGYPGTEVTEEQLARVRQEISALNAIFMDAVSKGRELKGKALEAVTDGSVWIASEAKARGLVDRISSFDEALEAAGSKSASRRAKASLSIERARG